jgi:hypothetical protein
MFLVFAGTIEREEFFFDPVVRIDLCYHVGNFGCFFSILAVNANLDHARIPELADFDIAFQQEESLWGFQLDTLRAIAGGPSFVELHFFDDLVENHLR